MQADLLETRLRRPSSLKLVTVELIAGVTAGGGRYGIAMAIPAPVVYLAGSSSAAELAEPTTITVGGWNAAAEPSMAQIFRKGSTTKTVSLAGDEATVRAALIAQLRA